ncbi:branched chain amino acid aminotransferase apoenzyme [Micromonospora pallida]|uniref:Branched chain amino acid aminotransferase apoenzyme n=1 Tax=Micromonospora pallida TaxID=145854 RepID=A0A1C6SD13_9ACTN|nr:aminotransferase class IV [Micromonospora pallida]SCL27362.1 branched chain amino acid aminotransferase apoenzyme [Micromonospora pallida]
MITASLSTHTLHEGDRGRDVPFGGNSMQHGTAVFEGIRCYAGVDGPHVFRLDDHLRRLLRSAELIGIPEPPSLDALRGHVLAAVPPDSPDCYLRPVLYAPDPVLGVNLGALRFRLGIEVWPAGPVTDQAGVALTVSPWRRPPPECFPAGAKATGAYVMSAVARTAAARAGFDDAVQLDLRTGRVVEATVSNIFLVTNGRLVTPWLRDGPLAGITRATVLTLAADLGIEAREQAVDVRELHQADEIFLTGTAMELAPVRSIENRPLDPARPVFRHLLARFRAAVTGTGPAPAGWRTPAHSEQTAAESP